MLRSISPIPFRKALDAASQADAGGAAAKCPSAYPDKSAVPAIDAESALYHAFRHGLHELSMALFPLRALYQAYWEKLAKETYPHDLLMEDPDYGRTIIENFFWDHFVQYSDARPILRTARELEGKELRLAHDLMQWSYSPLWFYRVQERNARTARLINLGNLKAHTVIHDGRLPQAGEGVLTRILPFRGKEFCGHVALAFNDGSAPADSAAAARLESLFRAGCRELGVKSSVTLRPDVHCDEWRRHGAVFLGLWRAETYDSTVGRPARGIRFRARFQPCRARPRCRVSPPSPRLRTPRPSGAGQWDLRFRAMRLARLEYKGGSLLVTVADPAFRAHVRDWIRDRLGAAAHASGRSRDGVPAGREPRIRGRLGAYAFGCAEWPDPDPGQYARFGPPPAESAAQGPDQAGPGRGFPQKAVGFMKAPGVRWIP